MRQSGAENVHVNLFQSERKGGKEEEEMQRKGFWPSEW